MADTKSQLMADTTTMDTNQPMAKNPMVTKSQIMADTTTTDTNRHMDKNPMVTKSQLTKSIEVTVKKIFFLFFT